MQYYLHNTEYFLSSWRISKSGGHLQSRRPDHRRRIAIFGHIARLSEEVPAHQALCAHVDLSLGRLPGRDWKRHPGRPNNRWVDQVHNDTGNMPSMLSRSAILRGHGTGATQRPSLATRTWWWWWDQTNSLRLFLVVSTAFHVMAALHTCCVCCSEKWNFSFTDTSVSVDMRLFGLYVINCDLMPFSKSFPP